MSFSLSSIKTNQNFLEDDNLQYLQIEEDILFHLKKRTRYIKTRDDRFFAQEDFVQIIPKVMICTMCGSYSQSDSDFFLGTATRDQISEGLMKSQVSGGGIDFDRSIIQNLYYSKEDEERILLEGLGSGFSKTILSARPKALTASFLNSSRLRGFEEDWINKTAFESLNQIFELTNKELLKVMGNKHLLPQLSSDIKRHAFKMVDTKRFNSVYLRNYFNSFSDFILNLYKVSLYINDDPLIEDYLDEIISAQLDDPKMYDLVSKKYSLKKKFKEVIEHHKEKISEYLLKEFYHSLVKSPTQLKRAARMVDALKLISNLLKNENYDEGEKMLRLHDYMLDLLITAA